MGVALEAAQLGESDDCLEDPARAVERQMCLSEREDEEGLGRTCRSRRLCGSRRGPRRRRSCGACGWRGPPSVVARAASSRAGRRGPRACGPWRRGAGGRRASGRGEERWPGGGGGARFSDWARLWLRRGVGGGTHEVSTKEAHMAQEELLRGGSPGATDHGGRDEVAAADEGREELGEELEGKVDELGGHAWARPGESARPWCGCESRGGGEPAARTRRCRSLAGNCATGWTSHSSVL